MLGIYCRTSKERDIETSTINQQRIAGIKFAEEHNFEYVIYEDEGKSGYKIDDFEQDPFKNRPEFERLISDIKNKKIDKVWVWEISRLSRNELASAYIFYIFENNKIDLYVNQKQYELSDPQIKMTRVILGAVAEYERELIVGRTSRGQKKQFEEGRRVHQKLFCYANDGKDKKGYTVWKPVESEIETYKYILKRYKECASLRKIMFEVYAMNSMEKYQFASYAAKMGTILRKYQYTGFQLTLEGIEIYKKFRKNEINNIQELKDRKYWIKSVPYPIELISIEDWVSVNESLQIRGAKMNLTKNERILRANKDIGTGIIECSDCGSRYYYKEQKSENKKTGWKKYYYTYFHNQCFRTKICNQYPRSFKIEDINEILKIFYFYFLLVFDNTNELIDESQRNIKQRQKKLKEEISKYELNMARTEKQVSKFQTALENTDDIEVIKILAKNISTSNDKIQDLSDTISKVKIEYEIQNERFNQNEREITYYDVKERILNWFYKLNIEEQRNELTKVIQKCQIFNHHILIDTGKIVFLFDINQHYIFDMKLLENLNKDEIYKTNFVKMTGKREAKKLNNKLFKDVNLERNNEIKVRVFEYLMQNYNIVYNFIGKTKFVSFVPLTGIMSLEIEDLEK